MSNFDFDNSKPDAFLMIAGPCVIESESLCMQVAEELCLFADKYEMQLVFKASYKKANRLSGKSYSGPGIDEGLKILQKVKKTFDLPLLTDIHETVEVTAVSEVVDILQIPAFLCRQTDLLQAAAATGLWVNIKKGQFLAPEDIGTIAEKTDSKKLMLTERGSSFGYRNLVVDFRSLLIMKETGYPVIFDVTHSLQLPGAGKGTSGGQPQYAIPMARAAVAVSVDGIFVETHPNPSEALSDATTMLPLSQMPQLLSEISRIRDAMGRSI